MRERAMHAPAGAHDADGPGNQQGRAPLGFAAPVTVPVVEGAVRR
jgi:hypothetical protein